MLQFFAWWAFWETAHDKVTLICLAAQDSNPIKKMPKMVEKKAGPAKKVAKGEVKVAAKRPRTAFILFCAEQRDQVKKDNPKASFGKVSKLLGVKWGKCPEKEKCKYEAMAKADKARYDFARLMDKFCGNHYHLG